MSILTTRLIAAGQLVAQGLLKYWQGKRAAKKEKKRIAAEVKGWVKNEQDCERVNRKIREHHQGRNPAKRITIKPSKETLQKIREGHTT